MRNKKILDEDYFDCFRLLKGRIRFQIWLYKDKEIDIDEFVRRLEIILRDRDWETIKIIFI